MNTSQCLEIIRSESEINFSDFIELIDASIATLQGKNFTLVPDFPTGGMADVEMYNDGLRGGRIRVRARIDKVNNKTLVVREVPFGVTTSSLIDSILKANDKGKIKIKKVEDNTAKVVEVVVRSVIDNVRT